MVEWNLGMDMCTIIVVYVMLIHPNNIVFT